MQQNIRVGFKVSFWLVLVAMGLKTDALAQTTAQADEPAVSEDPAYSLAMAFINIVCCITVLALCPFVYSYRYGACRLNAQHNEHERIVDDRLYSRMGRVLGIAPNSSKQQLQTFRIFLYYMVCAMLGWRKNTFLDHCDLNMGVLVGVFQQLKPRIFQMLVNAELATQQGDYLQVHKYYQPHKQAWNQVIQKVAALVPRHVKVHVAVEFMQRPGARLTNVSDAFKALLPPEIIGELEARAEADQARRQSYRAGV